MGVVVGLGDSFFSISRTPSSRIHEGDNDGFMQRRLFRLRRFLRFLLEDPPPLPPLFPVFEWLEDVMVKNYFFLQRRNEIDEFVCMFYVQFKCWFYDGGCECCDLLLPFI